MSQPSLPIKLRYESATDTETRYVFMLGDSTKIMRVYVDNMTRRVTISRGDANEPSHILPVEAVMTDEPDISERADRTGLRVKGTALAFLLLPSMPLLLVALAANVTVGQVISMTDIPIVTDEDLENFLKD
jgi:hypothetical protein